MDRRLGLLDQIAELLNGRENPQLLAERTLSIVLTLTNGRAGAVFALRDDRLVLFASRGIDQGVLETAEGVWSRSSRAFERGEAFYVRDRGSEPRLSLVNGAGRSLLVLPLREEGAVCGLLYLDSLDPHFCNDHDLARLGKFSGILVKAIRGGIESEPATGTPTGWESYLERTPSDDIEKQKLLLLLNRNEWNIARVARLMGITRRTVYLRLERYKIPREKVVKRLARPRAALPT